MKHPRLSLIEDEVRLPDGSRARYLRFDDKGLSTVTVIARRADGKILLQQEYSYPLNKKLWQLPGGHVQTNETPARAANRELQEESGFKAGSLKSLGYFLVNNRRSAARVQVYLATALQEKSLAGDREEDIDSFWFSARDITSLIKAGKIINTYFLAAWSLYINHPMK